MNRSTPAENRPRIKYPRRRVLRGILRHLITGIFATTTDLRIDGRENVPPQGPLLVVANHFSFLDPLAVIQAMNMPLEFIGGFQMINAPASVRWLPKLWGTLPVYRGSVSRKTLYDSEDILQQKGVLGIFPEAGNWATVLRPARPGAAYLAIRSQANILPIGIDGLLGLLPRLRQGKRARVHIKIGKPFGPLYSREGEKDRQLLEEVGNKIMTQIAELIPPERRGHFSDDPAIRAAAAGTEIYPWSDRPEG